MTCKGIVRGDVVVLEENAHLPDGARVEVHLMEATTSREDAFARVLNQRAANAGLQVHVDELIEEEKQEQEEYPDTWLSHRS
jgi:uncharacterized lipoprotein YbaY